MTNQSDNFFRHIGVYGICVVDIVKHLHHIAMLYEVQIDPEEKMSNIKSFEGQESNGALSQL